MSGLCEKRGTLINLIQTKNNAPDYRSEALFFCNGFTICVVMPPRFHKTKSVTMLQQKQDFPLTIEAIQHSRQKNYFDQA